MRQITPTVIKHEPVLVWRCMIHQKMRNHRLLGGALRTFFSQGTGSANLAPFCAKLRRIAPTHKTWTAVRRKLYNTSKEAESSILGGCSQNIFLLGYRKCQFGAILRQNAPNCANSHKKLVWRCMIHLKKRNHRLLGVPKDHFHLSATEVPFWRIFAPNCAKLRRPIKPEPLIAWRFLIRQMKQNYRLLGGVLRTLFS